MFWKYIDELLIMVGVVIVLTIIDSILLILKVDKDRKDLFMKWFNILGMAIILLIVFKELINILLEFRHFLHRL